MNVTKVKTPVWLLMAATILAGLFLRLYHISDNQFLFYDEALYIGYNRAFLNLIAHNPAHSLGELCIILSLIFKTALAMPKPLWFFLLSLRVFFLGPEAWFYARWISALSGLATVVVLYFWAKRTFNSRRIGLLSALILLVLPSHVFYSRTGMQEALSALLFLSAVHVYMLRARLGLHTAVSAFLLACVYFTNYRMLIAPVFIGFIELFKALTEKRRIDWVKPGVFCLCFGALVVFIGVLYGAINFQVTFAWIFHQAEDAGGNFNPLNFLSFPLDVFILEGAFFAGFFWANLHFIKIKDFRKLLPFGIVALQMLIFSLAAEKGARYLCVVLPFMAAAAAVSLDYFWQKYAKNRRWVLAAAALAYAGMIYLAASLTFAGTDYKNAVDLIEEHDPKAILVSTQPLVEGLYLEDESKIAPCPNDIYALGSLYQKGARYLVLDPQAYISWDADGKRFSPPLVDFLENLKNAKPVAVFPHLNQILLTRFVLDHNEQIMDSLSFLANADRQGYGKIRIYDLGSIFSDIIKK